MRWFITWMHPSYRDLVIDELATQNSMRIAFLKGMSLQGIKLAISDAGGSEGKRRLPLMTDSESWELLRSRSVDIIDELTCHEMSDLIMTFASASKTAKGDQELSRLIDMLAAVLTAVREKWNSCSEVFEANDLETYCEASLLIKPLPPLPLLGKTWVMHYEEFQQTLVDASDGSRLDESVVKLWIDLAVAIHHNEPRFLRQVGFPENYSNEISQFMETITEEVDVDTGNLDYDQLMSEKERFETLRDSVEILACLAPEYCESVKRLCGDLDFLVRRLELAASDLEQPDSDEYEDYYRGQAAEFDIDALFSDL